MISEEVDYDWRKDLKKRVTKVSQPGPEQWLRI